MKARILKLVGGRDPVLLDEFELDEKSLKAHTVDAVSECGSEDSLFLMLEDKGKPPDVIKFDPNFISEVYESMPEIPPTLLPPAKSLPKASSVWEPTEEAIDLLAQTLVEQVQPAIRRKLSAAVRTAAREETQDAVEHAAEVIHEHRIKVLIIGPKKEQFSRVVDDLPSDILDTYDFSWSDKDKKAPKGGDLYLIWTKFVAHKKQEQVESMIEDKSKLRLVSSFSADEVVKALTG
jgi:hypothetical protein